MKEKKNISKVATSRGKSKLVLVVVFAIFIYLLFNIFISDDEGELEKEYIKTPNKITTPIETQDDEIPEIPTLPDPPKIEIPIIEESIEEIEELPISLPLLSQTDKKEEIEEDDNKLIDLPVILNSDEEDRRKDVKRKSSIMLISGTPPKIDPTKNKNQDFTYRGDMNLILGKGKIIEAIIESAINSDFGGEIRAVVTKNIYSEWGKNILIPKGSRVFGNYATGINGAYGRIDILWNRIDLINGYSINLSGIGADNLGRKGNQGRVDNKFVERMSNAILKSALDIGVAYTLEKIVEPQISSQVADTKTIATNARNIATSTFIQTDTDATKRAKICSGVLQVITDKTSSAFTEIQNACNTLNSSTSGDSEKLSSLMSTINSSLDKLIQNTSNAEQTKTQEASRKAFDSISGTLETIVGEQQFTPTITINQGAAVKIYVNKDYKFPKEVLK